MNNMRIHQAAVLALLAMLLVFFAAHLRADGEAHFGVVSAQTHIEDEVYYLDAEIDFAFDSENVDAITNGVPITIEVQIEVLRPREYVWDEEIASIDQRYQLSYHTLARRFLIHNLNSGEIQSFSRWQDAVASLRRIEHFPMLDVSLTGETRDEYARIRALLDIEALPLPMRPSAYFSDRWNITSEWYQWPLHD